MLSEEGLQQAAPRCHAVQQPSRAYLARMRSLVHSLLAPRDTFAFAPPPRSLTLPVRVLATPMQRRPKTHECALTVHVQVLPGHKDHMRCGISKQSVGRRWTRRRPVVTRRLPASLSSAAPARLRRRRSTASSAAQCPCSDRSLCQRAPASDPTPALCLLRPSVSAAGPLLRRYPARPLCRCPRLPPSAAAGLGDGGVACSSSSVHPAGHF